MIKRSLLLATLALLTLKTSGWAQASIPQTELVGLAGKCLDVLGGDTADGTPVVLFRCQGTPNQRWTVPPVGSRGPIVGIGGKCLDAAGGATANRTPIQLFTCHGGTNQLWHHESNNHIYLVGGRGDKCLDVTGSQSADRTPTILFDCRDQANQRWRRRAANHWTELWLDPAESVTLGGTVGIDIDAANPQRVVAASRLRVYRTEDGGTSWQPLAALPTDDQIFSVAMSPTDQRTLFVGGRSVDWRPSLYRSDDHGATWIAIGAELRELREGAITDLLITDDGATLFAVVEAYATGLYRSQDGGITWEQVLTASYLRSVTVHPRVPERLYASGWDCVFRSDDGGATWRAVSFFAFDDIAVDAQLADVVYGNLGTYIYRSTDGGLTWSQLSQGRGHQGAISSLAASLLTPDKVVYTTYGGQTFLSNDRGSRWIELGPAQERSPLLTITADPRNPERWWAGTAGSQVLLGDWTLVPSVEDPLELRGGRFTVSLTWRDFLGETGSGHARALTDDSGYFWFFDANNVEVVVKILDGGAVNGHLWVFYGSLSNVEYTLTVTDTVTGQRRTYDNPLGTFASVGDTTAF